LTGPSHSYRQHPFFPQFCLLVGVVCIGFSAIFVRLADIPGVVSAFYRVLLASALLVPLWLLRRSGRNRGGRSSAAGTDNYNRTPGFPSRRTVFLALFAGVFFGVDLAIWHVSLFLTNAANATVLGYLAPVWVGLGAMAILKERMKKHYWPGVVLALSGMVVILGLKQVSSTELGPGNLLAIVASFFYAGYLLVAQIGRGRSGTLDFTTLAALSSTATLYLICVARGEQLTGFSQNTWLALLGLGLISHVIGWLAINYALGHIKASIASVTLLGQPVITALVAIPILGEALRSGQIYGGLLILGGIYLVNRP
jgi:drug/metabolite transporter (DMT)-like permease